jgi:hypothetical protein
MPLPVKEAKKYDNFRLKKQKEMTDAAFQKRRLKTHKNFADVYTKAAYDMYPSEMLKVLKEKDETLERLIVYLHFNENKMPEVIAAITAMPLPLIETVLLEHRQKKRD